MNNENILLFKEKELFSLDENLDLKDKDISKLENEIEKIISNLWNDTCPFYKEFRPLFSPFLQINLLRRLYIYYFSLSCLKKKYSQIKIFNTNVLVDIIGQNLNFSFEKNLKNHDDDFNLKRYYSFYDEKFSLKKIAKNFINFIRSFFQSNKNDIVFTNQTRLRNELKNLKNAESVTEISFNKRFNLDINPRDIGDQMKRNLNKLEISIPKILIEKLIEKRIINYLPKTIKRIEQISHYLKKKKTKLVIATGLVHEEDVILLVAAKICKVKTLAMGHGLSGVRNQFLDNYLDFQVTMSPQEYQYKGAKCLNLSSDWYRL